MKNILVPTDFSPEAHHAFELAVQLAQRTGGSVTLLHAVALPETVDFNTLGGSATELKTLRASPRLTDEAHALCLLRATQQQLYALVAEAAQLAPGVPVHELMQATGLSPSVQNVIAHRSIDLVVMGAQHHSAIEHFLVGSNTERLVRAAPCPVLAVKHTVPDFWVRQLVFPSDFSAEADYAVAELRRIQAVFTEATLHLLHVVTTAGQQSTALQKMADFARRHRLGPCVPAAVVAASPSAGIAQFAQQIAADLVVLPTHGRTGLRRLLQGSVAETVATHAFPPVLTFKLGQLVGTDE
jgi:nucleotide-binding universal stress UspA family protein